MIGFVNPKEYQDLPYQSKLWVSILSNRLVEYNESRKYIIFRPQDFDGIPGIEEDRLIISASSVDLSLVMENFKIFGNISYGFVTSLVGHASLFGNNHKIVGEDLPSSCVLPEIDHETERLEWALNEFDRLIAKGEGYIHSLPGRKIR